MGTYMGNVGHLMQHWILCEVLRVANKHVCGLNYIDAHAMAPWSTTRTASEINKFDSVKNCLWNCPPGQNSVYERAWKNMAHRRKREGYPSSAAFVRELWKGPYSLLLCERASKTADEIADWLTDINKVPKCEADGPFRGDWRDRFSEGLPNPYDMDLPEDSLTLISFDPDLYSIHAFDNGEKGKPKLYREDLDRTLNVLKRVEGPVIIQLSTYTNNGGNTQDRVISSVSSILFSCGFLLPAVVKANKGGKRMMSLVYERDAEWGYKLERLPNDFKNWLDAIPG